MGKKRKRKQADATENGPAPVAEEAGAAPPESVLDPDAAADVDSLRAERDALEEKLKRALADIANMRRRQGSEFLAATERGVERVVQELLPILDSLRIALASEQSESPDATLREGIELVHSMFEDLLGRHGIARIEAEGVAFDPALHEALAVEERDDCDANVVVAVHLDGYRIGERVLRPARVVVSRKPEAEAEPADDAEEAEAPD